MAVQFSDVWHLPGQSATQPKTGARTTRRGGRVALYQSAMHALHSPPHQQCRCQAVQQPRQLSIKTGEEESKDKQTKTAFIFGDNLHDRQPVRSDNECTILSFKSDMRQLM